MVNDDGELATVRGGYTVIPRGRVWDSHGAATNG